MFDGYVELPEGNFEVKSHGLPYGVTSAPGFSSSFNSTCLIRKKQTPGFIRPVTRKPNRNPPASVWTSHKLGSVPLLRQ